MTVAVTMLTAVKCLIFVNPLNDMEDVRSHGA